jgi:prepilin-type processing-associated H-X9-DG protein/prepilin-type N-terminal cleavage/methylation domain-containing protein
MSGVVRVDAVLCSNRRPAFTLIELMIVVAVIALLISILLPSLAKAREQAQSAVCATHLAEIFKGVHMYTVEYNESVPNVAENRINEGGWWTAQILPYVKEPSLFLCPGDKRPVWEYLESDQILLNVGHNVYVGRRDPGRPAYESLPSASRSGPAKTTLVGPVSYMGNCNTWTVDASGWKSRRLLEYRFPHAFLFLGEGFRGDGDRAQPSRCFEFYSDLCGGSPLLTSASGWQRHMGGSNYLFLDGHVEWATPGHVKNVVCERIEYKDRTRIRK